MDEQQQEALIDAAEARAKEIFDDLMNSSPTPDPYLRSKYVGTVIATLVADDITAFPEDAEAFMEYVAGHFLIGSLNAVIQRAEQRAA